ncbi:hypothetical protein RYH80_05815 [Halobaculum sp. MBLA0147]|uniref:hypothetical protein n=1 Tax=Halobaculum sp. MBLA0147 TaxID=3079934 RepID=UPI0035267EBC
MTTLLGIDDTGGMAVFGLHVVVGMLLLVPGVLNLVGGNLPQGGLMTLIGLMVVVAGRSVGRIMARR